MDVKYYIHWESLLTGATGHRAHSFDNENDAKAEVKRLNKKYPNVRHWYIAEAQGTYRDSDNWGKHPAAVRKW